MKNKIYISLLFIFSIAFVRVDAQELLYNTLKNKALRDDISSTYVTSSSGIDFNEVSSDTNGKGLYMIGSTRNDTYPIVYYRGDISNNNIIYAGYCWEIIRTTNTGGIKLQYAGLPNNNKCTNEKEGLVIGKSMFNDSNTVPKYGWMYDSGNGDVNGTDSIAKEYLDNWFEENMLDHVKELEDTVWCNDRTETNGTFNARTRLESGNPTLECQNIEDSFTVFSNKGNAKLTYPIAIINADEATYGGEVLKKTQTATFINKAYSYWSMTPYTQNKNMYPNSKGMLNMHNFTYEAGIRPMISLRNTAVLLSGKGTKENPYNAEVEKQYRIIPDDYLIVNKEEAEATEQITINPKEKSGFKYVSTKIYDFQDNELNITITNNKFKMPNKDIKLVSNYRLLKDFHSLTTTNQIIEIVEESVEEEQPATFKINVPHGYKVDEVILKDEDDNVLDITLTSNNNIYTFTMPNRNVIVDATLVELPKYEAKGNEVKLDLNEYYENDQVDFIVKEKPGFIISDVYLVDENGNRLDIEVKKINGKYVFNMPNESIEIVVDYKENKQTNSKTNDEIIEDEIGKSIINPETYDEIYFYMLMLNICVLLLIFSMKLYVIVNNQ